jgi:hypothetical protein
MWDLPTRRRRSPRQRSAARGESPPSVTTVSGRNEALELDAGGGPDDAPGGRGGPDDAPGGRGGPDDGPELGARPDDALELGSGRWLKDAV